MRGEAVPARVRDCDRRTDERQRAGGECNRRAERRTHDAVREREDRNEGERKPLPLLDEAKRDESRTCCRHASLARGNCDRSATRDGERRSEIGHGHKLAPSSRRGQRGSRHHAVVLPAPSASVIGQ
jgi:hypothetical protein